MAPKKEVPIKASKTNKGKQVCSTTKTCASKAPSTKNFCNKSSTPDTNIRYSRTIQCEGRALMSDADSKTRDNIPEIILISSDSSAANLSEGTHALTDFVVASDVCGGAASYESIANEESSSDPHSSTSSDDTGDTTKLIRHVEQKWLQGSTDYNRNAFH